MRISVSRKKGTANPALHRTYEMTKIDIAAIEAARRG